MPIAFESEAYWGGTVLRAFGGSGCAESVIFGVSIYIRNISPHFRV